MLHTAGNKLSFSNMGHTSKTNLKFLETQQKKIIRKITKAPQFMRNIQTKKKSNISTTSNQTRFRNRKIPNNLNNNQRDNVRPKRTNVTQEAQIRSTKSS